MRVPRTVLALAAAGLVLVAFEPAADAAAANPSALVTELCAQLGQVLSDRTLSSAEQKQRFRAILDADFDFRVISRFVLGRYWQGSSDAFHREFAGVFEDYVIQSLSVRFADARGDSVRITGTLSESARSTIVSTMIAHPDGTSQPNVDWRIEDTPDGLRIADISVAGVSMAMTYREQIASVIDHDGGQVASVIPTLRAKIDHGKHDVASGDSPATVGAQ